MEPGAMWYPVLRKELEDVGAALKDTAELYSGDRSNRSGHLAGRPGDWAWTSDDPTEELHSPYTAGRMRALSEHKLQGDSKQESAFAEVARCLLPLPCRAPPP